MGIRNYVIEGVSGTGKTSVCADLQRRGYHAIHGDRELAYRGDPETGEPTDRFGHAQKEDVPNNGISIDATAPIAHVVDEILRHTEE